MGGGGGGGLLVKRWFKGIFSMCGEFWERKFPMDFVWSRVMVIISEWRTMNIRSTVSEGFK